MKEVGSVKRVKDRLCLRGVGLWVFLFFFFQAEDGIRDHCVTGVQTCALPICSSSEEWDERLESCRPTWLEEGLTK